jgi:putative phosphoesterase
MYVFYKELVKHSKKLYAVQGNNDTFDVPMQIVADIDGVKVAITHGDMAKGNRENFLIYHFSHENPDIIVFGHSHKPLWVQIGDQTLLNPGSPVRNRGMVYNTFAIITTNNGKFDVEFREC